MTWFPPLRRAVRAALFLAMAAAVTAAASAETRFAQLINQLPGQQDPAASPAPAAEPETSRGEPVRRRLGGIWEARVRRADGTAGTLRFSFIPRFSNSGLLPFRVHWDDGVKDAAWGYFNTSDLQLTGSSLGGGGFSLRLNSEFTAGTGVIHLYGFPRQENVEFRKLRARVDRVEVLEPDRALDWETLSRAWSSPPLLRANMPRITVRLHGADLPFLDEDPVGVVGGNERVSYAGAPEAVKIPSERGRVLDLRFVLMPEPAETRYQFRVNDAPFALDLAFRNRAVPTLRFVDAGGGVLSKLGPGMAFRLAVDFEKPSADRRLVATLSPAGGTSMPVELRSAKGTRFESDRLALAPPGAAVDPLGVHLSPTVAHMVGRLYAGAWTVDYASQANRRVTGRGSAEIGFDAKSGSLTLTAPPDAAGSWRLVEAQWTDTVSQLRFRAANAAAPDGAAQVQVPSIAVLLVATAERIKPASAVLEKLADLDKGWTMRASLTRQSDGRLTGTWAREDANASLGADVRGQMTWSRAPSIDAIAELPVSPEANPASYLVGYRGDRLGISPERRLLVIGRQLPVGPGDARAFPPNDPNIAYRFQREVKADDELFAQADAVMPEGGSAMLVLATIAPDTGLGEKRLTLNQMSRDWPLDNPTTPTRIAWVQPGGRPRADHGSGPVDRALGIEDLEVVMELGAPVRADRLRVGLLRDGQAIVDGSAELPRVTHAARTSDEDGFIYRTPPVRLHLSSQRPSPRLDTIEVMAGTRIGAMPLDPVVRSYPARVEVTVEPSDQPGGPWKAALERVAACRDDPVPIPDPDAYAGLEARKFSRILITDTVQSKRKVRFGDGERDLSIRVGDHAAALLLRGGAVTELQRLVPVMRAIANADNDLIRSFRAELAKGSAGALMNGMYARLPNGAGEAPLADTLDLPKRLGTLGADRGRYYGMTLDEAERWAAAETRAAASRFAQAVALSVSAASGIDACDAPKLIALAGHRAPSVVAELMPQLVKLTPQGRAVPDAVARSHVTSLPVLSDAIRALEEYSAIDDAFKSMAVAVASAGAMTAFSGAATLVQGLNLPTNLVAATTSGLQVAGVATEGAAAAVDTLWAAQAYRNTVDANRAADLARGFVPVYGERFASEAEARRASEALALVGAIVPAVATSLPAATATQAGLARLGKEVFKPSALARGAALAERVLSRAEFSALDETQQIDLAAWYAAQAPPTPASLARLSPAQRDTIRTMDRWADTTRSTPVRLPTDETRVPAYVPALPHQSGRPLQNRAFTGITENGEPRSFQMGAFRNAGASNDAFVNASPNGPPGTLLRISKPARDTRKGKNPASVEALGRRALEEADPSQIARPRLYERVTLRDANGEQRIVEVVQDVGERASDVLRRQPGGRMTAEQAIAYDRGVRELNRRGWVVLDGHGGNFAYVRGEDGTLRASMFDPGGILPILGRDPEVARHFQTQINAPAPLMANAEPGAPVHLFAATGLRDEMLPELERAIDTSEIDVPLRDIIFTPIIGYEQPALRSLFMAKDPDAAYAALRAEEAAARR